MKLTIYVVVLLIGMNLQAQNQHSNSAQNFTVQRLIILNDSGEMLMAREKHVWAPVSYIYNDRQYIKEGLDSLAEAYGIQIKDIELRGQFSYKYDYQPYATLRNYYIAKYENGSLKIPEPMDEVRWMSIEDAIETNTITSIRDCTNQILSNPSVVWGASFMVSHIGNDHPTKMTEPFHALFRLN